MRRYKYVGEDEREVPSLGVVVNKGDVVEVKDPDVADGLDGQDLWEHVPDPERSKAAKKAAAERSDDQED